MVMKLVNGSEDKVKIRNYQKEWIQKRREKYLENFGCCVFCGSENNIQIHHVDPKTKESHKIWSWADERVKAELKQCLAMCEHCHSLFHSILKMKPIQHGTLHAYQRYGCRCEECKKARSDYYWEKEKNAR